LSALANDALRHWRTLCKLLDLNIRDIGVIRD